LLVGQWTKWTCLHQFSLEVYKYIFLTEAEPLLRPAIWGTILELHKHKFNLADFRRLYFWADFELQLADTGGFVCELQSIPLYTKITVINL
jgi:hypothetical protein